MNCFCTLYVLVTRYFASDLAIIAGKGMDREGGVYMCRLRIVWFDDDMTVLVLPKSDLVFWVISRRRK